MNHTMSEAGPRKHLRLYLMRHGEIERSANTVRYGHTDIALSARGKEQSHRLCEALAQAPIAAVYASDLSRAASAADIIARTHDLAAIRLSALREIDMGEWEGKPFAEINAVYPETVARLFHNPRDFRYPGGESFAEFERRVRNALEMILARHESGEIAVMTHAGVCRLIIGSVLELKPENWLRLAQGFGCINIIDWYNGLPILEKLNHIGHEIQDLKSPLTSRAHRVWGT